MLFNEASPERSIVGSNDGIPLVAVHHDMRCQMNGRIYLGLRFIWMKIGAYEEEAKLLWTWSFITLAPGEITIYIYEQLLELFFRQMDQLLSRESTGVGGGWRV